MSALFQNSSHSQHSRSQCGQNFSFLSHKMHPITTAFKFSCFLTQTQPPPKLCVFTLHFAHTEQHCLLWFLGSTITQDLKWVFNIDTAADAILHRYYSVCSLHIHHCLVWIGLQTGQEQTTADSQDCRKNHWFGLPSIQDLYMSRFRKQVENITADPSHPGHNLFQLLSSGRCYRALYVNNQTHEQFLSTGCQSDEQLTGTECQDPCVVTL